MCTNLLLYLFNSFVQQPISGIVSKYKCIHIFVFSHFFLKQYHQLINTNTLLKYVHCLQVEHHGQGHVSSQQQHKIWIPIKPIKSFMKIKSKVKWVPIFVIILSYLYFHASHMYVCIVLYLIFSSPCQNLKRISYAVRHHIFHEYCFQAWVVFLAMVFEYYMHSVHFFIFIHQVDVICIYWNFYLQYITWPISISFSSFIFFMDISQKYSCC